MARVERDRCGHVPGDMSAEHLACLERREQRHGGTYCSGCEWCEPIDKREA